MVYNHVHCNSLYPGRATYFYPRAANFFALYARRELWFSGTTVIVSYDSRTEVMNGSGSRGTDVTIPSAACELRKQLADQYGVSERTLRRYVNAYHANGLDGLKPAERVRYRKNAMPDNYEELLEEAIQLRREVPRCSIEQIILILEMEGKAAPGVLKRPTLQRHMYQAGFGAVHMDIYRDARKSSSRRFCKPHRMMLVQGDIKYGPKLPIGRNGAMVQTYLSSAIDDHSRMILASEFYDNQEEAIVEDTFHKAVLKYGRFDKC